MKRFIFIVLYLISCICLVAQTTKTYTLTFSEHDFSFIKSRTGDYIISNTQPLCYGEDTFLPEIPYMEVKILLPENCVYDGFSYKINDSVFVEKEMVLKSNSYAMPMSQIPSYPPVKDDKYLLKNYPFEIEMMEEDKLCGYRYVVLKVSPFSYNAKVRELWYASEIELAIKLKESYLPHPKTTFYSKESIELMIKNMILNPEDFYIPEQRVINAKSSKSNHNESFKYLIVTSDSLKNAFQTLAKWKTTKGVKAKIETVENIYNNYEGVSGQIKIKKCIYDYKLQGLEYVLLGGDVEIVPTQGCYGYVKNATPPKEDFNIPTDLFYSLFDGNFSWNADGDSIIGELEDSVSFNFSENVAVAISRIPVSTPQEAESFIEKTINYELNPSTNGYNKMLLVGNETYFTQNGQSDAEIRSMKLYNSYVKKYKPDMELSYFFDTNTSFEGGASYELDSTNLQTQLSKGFHHIHVMTHGVPTAWVLEEGLYKVSKAQSLCNTNTPSIILTSACYTNAFDRSNLCLSEALLRNPQSGVVAFFGSSREGWGTGENSYSMGVSLNNNALFYRALFLHKINRLGKIVVNLKDANNPTSYAGPGRWLHFSLNTIGDPELPIYTELPKSIKGVSWVHQGNNLHVSTDSVGYTVTLSSKTDNTNSYFQTIADIDNSMYNFVFQNIDTLENYQLCITKDNYKPLLITNLESHVIVQNQTFTGTSIIDGDEIIVGSNISSAVEEGPVVIESGHTMFDATKTVTIRNGFECKKGAILEIK